MDPSTRRQTIGRGLHPRHPGAALLAVLLAVGCDPGDDKPTDDDTPGNTTADTGTPDTSDTGTTDTGTPDTGTTDTGTLDYPLVIDLGGSSTRFAGRQEEGSLGYTLAGGGDVDGDGLPDVVIGVPFGDRAFLFTGPVPTDDLAQADTDWQGDYAAYHVDIDGDLEGDGLDDVLMGSRVDVFDPGNEPVARIFAGRAGGDLGPFERALAFVYHDEARELAQGATQVYQVAWLGDVDNSGNDAYLVANPGAGPGTAPGTVWLLPGGLIGEPELDLSATARFIGAVDRARVGSSFATLDAEADGVPDLITAVGLYYAGGALVVGAGDSVGDVILDGSEPGIVAGSTTPYAVLDAGVDVTGDGYDDVLVGTHDGYDGDPTSRVVLIAGPLTGVQDTDQAVAVFEGSPDVDSWISTARFAGDLNGDGEPDVAVGAPGGLISDPGGIAALFLGPAGGTRTLDEADVRWLGEEIGAEAGHALAAAGDVDGDGRDDLLVGSPGTDTVSDGEGTAYLLWGAELP